MGYYDLDLRTQLLLEALFAGIKISPSTREGRVALDEMTKEGLFVFSNSMFRLGYLLTQVGEQVANKVWRELPIQRVVDTRYCGHPQVRITLNRRKEEELFVVGSKYTKGLRCESYLFSVGGWLIIQVIDAIGSSRLPTRLLGGRLSGLAKHCDLVCLTDAINYPRRKARVLCRGYRYYVILMLGMVRLLPTPQYQAIIID
ncbi:MAG: hypothetical protein PVI21_01375 [Candidatus Woesebacteria bacterium]